MTVTTVQAAGRLSGLLLILAFAAVRILDIVPVVQLRSFVFDLYQLARPRTVDSYPVRIIDIDEKSLKEVGQWPWSRAVIAELVERLEAGGVAVIGFDVLFAEPDRLSPKRFIEASGISDERLRALAADLPDTDQRLAEAFAKTRVVLGQAALNVPGPPKDDAAPAPRTSVATLGGDPRPYVPGYPRLLTNLPALESTAVGRGLFTVTPERDGVIRRAPTLFSVEDVLSPALSIELLRVATGAQTILVRTDEAGVSRLAVAGVEIPTDRDGQIWVHFGAHDPNRYISAVDILRGRVAPEAIEGRIAIVGTSAIGLFDLRSTPVERVIPGVEIHAQMIENMVSRAILIRPNFALGAELVLAVLIGLAMVIAVPMLGALPTLLLGAVAAALTCAMSWYLFVVEHMLIDVTYPLASSGSVFVFLTFLNYLREEQRRAQIRTAFRQYLSPDLVEQLAREPDRLSLGGETREMTILFSDVRGFTAIAESFKSNPEGLAQLMNRLLTPLSKAVIERRGTIDKYMGDAIMAFWNAPLDDADHARHGCAAALEILRRLDALNAERAAEAAAAAEPVVRMQIGVGVATGVSIVGNMGSDIRFDYSVLGDSVNVASRLEGLTAQYGVRILVSEATAARCADAFAVLEIDRVRVKGKAEAQSIFALLGEAELAQAPHFLELQRSMRELLVHVRHQEWDAARSSLARCREVCRIAELAPVLDLYARRIAEVAAESRLTA